MALRQIGASLVLDGEKEFKKGINDAARGLRVLDSELKASAAGFAGQEKSMKSLTATGEILEKKVAQQKEVINALTKAVKESSEMYGEADKRTDGYQIKLNNATAALAKMERELSKNRQAIDELGRETEKAASKMERFKVKAEELSNSLNKTGKKLTSMGKSISKKITVPIVGAATAAVGLVATLGFGRLKAMDEAKAQLEGLGYAAEDVARISKQVSAAVTGTTMTMAEGTSVAAGALAAGVKEGADLERFIKLVGNAAVGSKRDVDSMALIFNRIQGSGKLTTQELNQIEGGMPGFSQAMAKASGVTLESFRKMVTDGKITSKQFLKVMDDFAGGMAEAQAKTWSGMVANTKSNIGKLGENLLGGVFEQSKETIAEFLELLRSDDLREWAVEAGDAIGKAFTGIIKTVKNVIKWFTNLSPTTQKAIGVVVALSAAIGPLLIVLGAMANGLSAIIAILPVLGAAFTVLTGPVGLVVLAAAGLIAIIKKLWDTSPKFRNWVRDVGDAIKNGFNNAINYVVDKLNWLIDKINKLPGVEIDNINKLVSSSGARGFGEFQALQRYASGTNYHLGGLAWVGEQGPEIVNLPRGSQVYNNQQSMAMVNNGRNNILGVYIHEFQTNDKKLVAKFAEEIRLGNRRLPQGVTALPFGY